MDTTGTAAGTPTAATPDRFTTEPFTAGDYAIHLTGGLLNLAVTVPAAIFLVSHADQLARGWPLAIVALVAGTFVADFVSGFLHWAFDTYFSDSNLTVKRMVVLVREHHIYPDRIFEYSVWQEAGILCWFGALVSAPLYATALFVPGVPGPLRAALVVAGLTASLEITFMLEFHKAGHRRERGRLVRALQSTGLLLSPEHHLRHHAGRHDTHYCLINGIADNTLGRLGVFRAMEAVIAASTGAIARQHDRELLSEYGKLPPR